MGQVAKTSEATTVELVTLADEINEEHRACEAAYGKALEHAIRCGELLIEAKERAGHGGWLEWLRENCDVSSRHAQRYMQLANGQDMINTTRVSDLSLRGAMRELRESKAVARERRRQEWAQGAAQRQQEYMQRVRSGEIRVPLEMAVSHTYDFEARPDVLEDRVYPVLCLVGRDDLGNLISLVDQPDWSDEERLRELDGAVELGAGDQEFLNKLCTPGWRDNGEADLEASSRLFDDELNFQPPIRELAWDDDGTLLLPTGHLAARLVGDALFVWWVWDSVRSWDAEHILNGANTEHVDTRAMRSREHFITCPKYGKQLPTDRWANARDLESALLADLEVVRERMASATPYRTDPQDVYEIGERVLAESEKSRPTWQRFAAFVRSQREVLRPVPNARPLRGLHSAAVGS